MGSNMRKRRQSVDPRNSVRSEQFKTSQAWTARRARRLAENKYSNKSEDKPSPDTMHVDNWNTDKWVGFLNGLFKEFEIPVPYWEKANPYQKKAVTKSFVESGINSLKNSASLLEAVANLIVTWSEEDFPFYSSKPEVFHLGYVEKAWDSYMKAVRKNPSLRLSCYNVSDNFSQSLKLHLKDSDTTAWFVHSEPTSSENTILDQDIDDLLN